MNKNKLRAYLIVGFIIFGFGGIVYENTKPPVPTYEGVGDGYNGDILVKIQAKKNKNNELRILNVNVKHEDTEAIAGPAIGELKNQTLLKQGKNIEEVAGATYTSEGYKDALNDAISKVK